MCWLFFHLCSHFSNSTSKLGVYKQSLFVLTHTSLSHLPSENCRHRAPFHCASVPIPRQWRSAQECLPWLAHAVMPSPCPQSKSPDPHGLVPSECPLALDSNFKSHRAELRWSETPRPDQFGQRTWSGKEWAVSFLWRVKKCFYCFSFRASDPCSNRNRGENTDATNLQTERHESVTSAPRHVLSPCNGPSHREGQLTCSTNTSTSGRGICARISSTAETAG